MKQQEIDQLKSALVEQERLFHRSVEQEMERSKTIVEKLEGTIHEQRKFIEIMVSQKTEEVFFIVLLFRHRSEYLSRAGQ